MITMTGESAPSPRSCPGRYGVVTAPVQAAVDAMAFVKQVCVVASQTPIEHASPDVHDCPGCSMARHV
jgi:hypothetical protein